MARLLLRVPHRGHEAGEIIEVDSRRASTLVLEKVGVLAPPKPPSTAIERLREILLQFRVGLDSLDIPEEDQEEAKALLRNAIVPILPAFVQTMTPEEFNASQAEEAGESAQAAGQETAGVAADADASGEQATGPDSEECQPAEGEPAESTDAAKQGEPPAPVAKPEPVAAKPAKAASAKKPQGKK